MLKKTIVLFLGIVAFFGLTGTKSVAAPNAAVSAKLTAGDKADGREIYKLINRERRKKGLLELNWSADLQKLAQSHAQKMADGRFFSHYGRNGDSVADRADALRIRGWRKIGENLFMGRSYSLINNVAVEKWMRSAGHRQNILNSSYNTTGIGIAAARDGTIYITQVFAQN